MSMLSALKTISKSRKKQLSLIPYIFTFASVFFGLVSVIKALEGDFIIAAYCIIAAAFMDMLDGRLARAFGSSSLLGMELDSLSDAVSFCFVPVIVLYGSCLHEQGAIGILVLLFYLCCGLFRLAKFNVSSNNSPSVFIGLPTTVSAFLFANLIIKGPWLAGTFFKILLNPLMLLIVITMISLLMISPFIFPSFKHCTLSKKSFYTVISLLSLISFICVLYEYPIFLLGTTLYISACVVYNACLFMKTLVNKVF